MYSFPVVSSTPFRRSTDTRLRLIGPLVLLLTGALFFRLKLYFDTPAAKLPFLIGVALTSGYIGWELTRATALFLQHRLPSLQRSGRRLFCLILSVILIAHFGYILRNLIHSIIGSFPFEWPSFLDYSSALGVLIFYATVTLTIYEGGYLRTQWQQTFAEKEALIRSEWQARFDLLRNQISPHFLFNSLNVLSSLISEDPEKAEQFTNELSKVYRYLLRNNDQELVTLDAELQFIRSYTHLLQTRFGEGLQLELDISPTHTHYLLPSLTLQVLVENAVKHNVVSRTQPLRVIIRSAEADSLIVENKIQQKDILVPSNGMGLSNIQARFNLLNQRTLVVESDTDRFAVHVPLLPSSQPGKAKV